jgi:hypothetical protein
LTFGKKMKRVVILLVAYMLLVATAAASRFSTQYISASRQMWFFAQSDEESTYRICVVTFGHTGEPQKAVFASTASYTDRVWSIREGREVIFEEGSLEARSAKKIFGIHSALSFDPKSPPVADPRIVEIGRVILFSAESSRPSYVNASIFTVDESSHMLTYIFARRAIMDPQKKYDTVRLSGISLVRSWPDSRVPEMATAEAMSLP